ncbi:MAG: hypothetical protein QXT27_00285 [Pyrobaculum sp.]
MRLLLLIALGVAAALALVQFFNTTHWLVNASLPPVSKDLNTSLRPLADARFVYSGDFNVTYYYIKFMPGWPEIYQVGTFRDRHPGWWARLEALARSGNPGGTYAIALGGQTQITNTQDAGPYVATPAALVWQTTTTSRYSILARAWFNQGGAYAVQLINFTAEPMQRLRQWTFNCGAQTVTEQFNYYCTYYGTDGSLSFGWEQQYAPPGVSYSTWTRGNVQTRFSTSRTEGSYSLEFVVDGTADIVYAVGALIWDVRNLGVTTDLSIQLDRFLTYGDGSFDELIYIQFEIELLDGSRRYVYYVWRICDATTGWYSEIWDVINRQRVCTYDMGGQCATTPPAGHLVKDLGRVGCGQWGRFFPDGFNLGADTGLVGLVTRIAFVVVDGRYNDGAARGRFDNLVMQWRRVVQCPLPSYISPLTRGVSNTGVSIDPFVSPSAAPSLLTRVDADGANRGYAVARYWLSGSPFGGALPAAGSVISVLSRYGRDGADVQNNAAFVTIGVDLDGDGQVDREYIYYRVDAASGYRYAIVSSFISPGSVICDVGAGQTCTNQGPYFFTYLGALSGDQSWAINLGDLPGAVVAVAFGVVDYSGSAAGPGDDFWVYWDDFSIQFSRCPPPGGWSAQGYVWQSYNYLLVTGGLAYVPLVQGGLVYIANFTGVGRYVFLTSGLADSFGVYWRGAGGGCVYGFQPPPSAARWVDLRPLAGLGDVLVRDQNGGVLTRLGCQSPAPPAYVGFRAAPGEVLKIYILEVWG